MSRRVFLQRQLAHRRRDDRDPADPPGVLAAEGELEHAALAGLAVGGPGRVLVVPDGVSTVAAALAALAFVPPLRPTDRPKEAAC